MLVGANHIKPYMLEKCVDSPERGVGLRRRIIAAESDLTKALTALPYVGYDYSKVRKRNRARGGGEEDESSDVKKKKKTVFPGVGNEL